MAISRYSGANGKQRAKLAESRLIGPRPSASGADGLGYFGVRMRNIPLMSASVNEATVAVRIDGHDRVRRDKNFSALTVNLHPFGQRQKTVYHRDHLH